MAPRSVDDPRTVLFCRSRAVPPRERGRPNRGVLAQGLFGLRSGVTTDRGDSVALASLSPDEIAGLFYRLGLADGARGGGAAGPAEEAPSAQPLGCGGGGAERA